MSKNNDSAKSIHLGEASDGDEMEELTEAERKNLEDMNDRDKKVSYWDTNQECRDHAMQMILLLSANLGVEIDGDFKTGVYADKNINGLRTFISHKDDKESREIMIYASTTNVMTKFVIPCFLKSEDDPDIMVPLLKLFLSLTRGLSPLKREAVVNRVKEKPQKQESKAECLKRVKTEKHNQANAYEQLNALMKFKEAIVCDGVFSIIYDSISAAIGKDEKERSLDDLKSIETVLFLLCNLLQIQAGPYSRSSDKIHSRSLQNKLILILEKNYFLDMLLLLCTSINVEKNKQWGGLVMEILHYILWDRDMKDLVYAIKHKDQTSAQYQALKNLQQRQANAGKLSSQLQKDRLSRQAAVHNSDQCLNRLGGMIRQAPKVDSSLDSSKEKRSSFTVLKRSLTGQASGSSHRGAVGSQINSTSLGGRGNKRGKKIIFADSKSTLQSTIGSSADTCSSSSVNVLGATLRSSMVGGLGDEERRVNIVLADFLTEFVSDGFGEIVHSMKSSWSRADASSPRIDLLFYYLTTACLQFERLFHVADQRVHFEKRDKGETSEPWMPNLRKITECFDRMMITHPADTVRKHFDTVGKDLKSAAYGDVAVPMLLYKETISFLRIMLESEEIVHNDIAIAAMYRIFYNPTTAERLDILPALLKNWNPRYYSKSHMFAVVELSHETLKLLDVASMYVAAEKGNEQKKLSKKAIRALEGRDLMLGGAELFDKTEYFLRLVSTTAVAMYTKALEYYRENSTQLNHYIYCFLKRMKDHTIETDEDDKDEDEENEEYRGLSDAERKKKQVDKKLNLGHMLFNIGTLNVFSVMLNDQENQKNIEQLLQLIKCMVRKFGELASKNHLLYVEVLLHQPFPVKAIGDMASTYHAAELAKNYRTSGKIRTEKKSRQGTSKSKRQDHHEQAAQNSTVYSSESEASSNEFTRLAQPVEKPTRSRKKKSDLRERIEKKRGSRKKSSANNSDDSDDDQIGDDELADLQADQQAAPASRGRRTSKIQWSSAEDAILRQLYNQYANSRSVFAMIAQDASLIELGGNKNAQKIEKRVQQLELHLALANMLSSEEGGSEEDGESAASESDGASFSGSEAGSSGKMSVDGEDGKAALSGEVKKRKRKGKKEKKRDGASKEKKQKVKSKSKSKPDYFLNPDDQERGDGGNVSEKASDDEVSVGSVERSDDNQSDDGGDAARAMWTLGSPAVAHSKEQEKGSAADKPFWEDDLEEEGDGEGVGFEHRMRALAAGGSGTNSSVSSREVGSTTGKKSSLKLKKTGRQVIEQSDESGSDLDIVEDAADAGGSHAAARNSILIDSDDDE